MTEKQVTVKALHVLSPMVVEDKLGVRASAMGKSLNVSSACLTQVSQLRRSLSRGGLFLRPTMRDGLEKVAPSKEHDTLLPWVE